MSAPAWTDLRLRKAGLGRKSGYEVIDATQLPNVVLGFVWSEWGSRWRAVAFTSWSRVAVNSERRDGTFETRQAAAKAVDLRSAREPDVEPSAPEFAEQPRLVFGGRR